MFLIILSIVTVCYIVYYCATKRLNYWKDRNVAGPKPLFPFGNTKQLTLRRKNLGEILKEIYDVFPNEKIVGLFQMTTPFLLLKDLDIIKQVLIKDFDNFTDRGFEISEQGMGANLFHANNVTWKILRSKLSPLFTSGKLKNMFHLMINKTDQFMMCLDKVTKNTREHEIYNLVSKYTLATIASCAFGIEIGVEDKMEDLRAINDIIFTINYGTDLEMMFPGILKALNMSVFPKVISNFFKNIVDVVYNERKGVPSNRKDFMDLIFELKKEKELTTTKKVHDGINTLKITDDVIAAQAFIFYAAGFETSASTMEFMLYELAMNPEIQNKLISEIDEALAINNNEITYDYLNEMTYLGKVFDETLRKYPLVDPLQRKANNDYRFPGTNVTVKKGQTVLISCWGIHHDEKYYSNPTKFDPERFDPHNCKDRHSCAYLSFGTGPRNCIGLRFGKVQVKIGIVKFLSKYRVERSEKTPQKIEFDPYKVIMNPVGGIYLNIVSRF